MPELVAFDGEVLGFGWEPTDPGQYDLLGGWNPGASLAVQKQVVRGRLGQVVRIVLTPDGSYDPQTMVNLYLEDDPDDPTERPCEVGDDNTITVVISAQTTAAMDVRSYPWEVWADGDKLPLATGILIMTESVRQRKLDASV